MLLIFARQGCQTSGRLIVNLFAKVRLNLKHANQSEQSEAHVWKLARINTIMSQICKQKIVIIAFFHSKIFRYCLGGAKYAIQVQLSIIRMI